MEFVADEEFQRMSIWSILKQSMAIPKSSPKCFFLVALSFILPLTLTILFFPRILGSVAGKSYQDHGSAMSISNYHSYAFTLFFYIIYLIIIFIISLLASSACVFIVASLYTSTSTTFSSTLSAIPRIFPRVFRTVLWISFIILIYDIIFLIFIPVAIAILTQSSTSMLPTLISIACILLVVLLHVYGTAVWQLANVVSVLEPVCGLGAVKKSHELLKGKRFTSVVLMLGSMFLSGAAFFAFVTVVEHGGSKGIGMWVRVLLGLVLVVLLVGLVLKAMLVQCVFYFVCKSYHGEVIDKNVMLELLGWYVRVHVKLNCMV